jgi:hypothetical protein
MRGESIMSGGDSRNKRTGLILAAVALGFFFAVVLKYWLMK